ncbi:MAG: hypothetical protein KI790_02890 [Cyclobacteriaceae bacterium]|nr:hypothetical protein [Cyclobacteriaceae bacterium HetDA_MAG_MS6]
MKRTLFVAVIAASLFASSCGEAGLGFNVSKEWPIDFPVDFPTGDFVGLPGFDPPALEADYRLDDIDDFADALEDLDNSGAIVFNTMSYEISGVSTAEEFELDDVSVTVVLADNSTIEIFNFPDPPAGQDKVLTNISKTEIPLSSNELERLQQSLTTGGRIGTRVAFDFAEAPTTDIEIDFRLFFDVTLRARTEF